MSPLNFARIAVACLLLIPALQGCGDVNPQAKALVHTDEFKKTAHALTATKSSLTSCLSCHGSDLQGGISAVSCTQCHLGSATSVHPRISAATNDYWAEFAPVLHGDYIKSRNNSAASCVVCHGANLQGSGTATSCTSCHQTTITDPALMNVTAQRHPWLPNVADNIAHGPYLRSKATYNYTSCKTSGCHGPDAITRSNGNENIGSLIFGGKGCLRCHGPGNPLPIEGTPTQ